MFKSSKIKKIISFMLVAVLAVSAVVLPVSAAETTTEEVTESDYNVWDDLSDAPAYSVDDINYTGEHSTDVNTGFNVRKEFGLSWCLCDYYMSRPFKFFYNWNYSYDESYYRLYSFAEDGKKYASMFDRDTFDSGFNKYIERYGISLDDYDIYYTFYYRNNTYGNLILKYYCVPKGMHIAFSNQGLKKGEPDNYKNVEYGVKYPRDNKDVHTIEISVNGETKALDGVGTYYLDNPEFESYTGREHTRLIATNMPIFDLYSDAVLWANTGAATHNPSNSAPQEPEEEKVGADAFYWDSLKCRISQQGQAYNFIYDYSYSVPDMVAHPEEYAVYTDYSQVINFKMNKALTYQQSKFDAHSSFSLASSNKSVVDTVTINKVDKQVNNLNKFLLALDVLSAQKFLDTDFANAELLSAHIYVTVTLVHTIDGGNGLSVKDKVSSDVRTFKFDATTLESLDSPEEIKSDVKIDDTKDENGKVIDRTVSQVVTNDNSTHQTINNYYYDSDGNRKGSSGSSIGDSLSDIASGLINFIKTLVTEGLPAALEVLKTLIKSISDLIGFAVDQIGDIGQGASNGLIAVLKAIPVPLWGICSVGLIVFVVAGVSKKIF